MKKMKIHSILFFNVFTLWLNVGLKHALHVVLFKMVNKSSVPCTWLHKKFLIFYMWEEGFYCLKRRWVEISFYPCKVTSFTDSSSYFYKRPSHIHHLDFPDNLFLSVWALGIDLVSFLYKTHGFQLVLFPPCLLPSTEGQ